MQLVNLRARWQCLPGEKNIKNSKNGPDFRVWLVYFQKKNRPPRYPLRSRFVPQLVLLRNSRSPVRRFAVPLRSWLHCVHTGLALRSWQALKLLKKWMSSSWPFKSLRSFRSWFRCGSVDWVLGSLMCSLNLWIRSAGCKNWVLARFNQVQVRSWIRTANKLKIQSKRWDWWDQSGMNIKKGWHERSACKGLCGCQIQCQQHNPSWHVFCILSVQTVSPRHMATWQSFPKNVPWTPHEWRWRYANLSL